MNEIPVEVIAVEIRNIKKRKMTITVESRGLDFYVPRTLEKFTMVPTKDLQELKDKAWMYDDLNK